MNTEADLSTPSITRRGAQVAQGSCSPGDDSFTKRSVVVDDTTPFPLETAAMVGRSALYGVHTSGSVSLCLLVAQAGRTLVYQIRTRAAQPLQLPIRRRSRALHREVHAARQLRCGR